MRVKLNHKFLILCCFVPACGLSVRKTIGPERVSGGAQISRVQVNRNLVSSDLNSLGLEYSSWVDEMILKYSLADGNDHGCQVIEMKMLPNQWMRYLVFQRRVAALIPEEEKRPSVDLTLTEAEGDLPVKSIGVLGGTGPSADSELIRLIVNQLSEETVPLDWRSLSINLFSSPPPRSFGAMRSRLVHYLKNLSEFATRGHLKYYLASNTAHSRIAPFSLMVRATFFRSGVSHPSFPVVDLVSQVVQRLSTQSLQDGSTLLILGTRAAYDFRLYPNYLMSAGWIEGDWSSSEEDRLALRPGQFFTVSSSQVASDFQSAIDLAKAGKLAQARVRMRKIIFSEVARIPKNLGLIKIVFACTEIPMVIRGQAKVDLIHALERRFNRGVEFVDTGEIFSEKIAEDLILINQSEPRRSD